MSEFMLWWHSPTTIVFLLGAVAYAAWHRMMNATIELRWSAKTTEPEASALRRDRGEARREAERLRGGT